jgi:hypothetical protein|tara:strand:+ start:638 stop:808 length:171 start_codon:yes stop_codon:yes gene_type:complete
MTDIHTIAQCSMKLVVLLEKLDSLDKNDPSLKYKVEDVKALGRELERESEFISGIR